MDGFRDVERSLGSAGHYPTFADTLEPVFPTAEGLVVRRMDDLQTLLVTKTLAGMDSARIEAIRKIVRDAAAGRLGALKFLVLDFAHDGEADAAGAEGFHALVNELANLILKAPIVSVACARAHMVGADLELALACSMIIGEDGARFSFAADPVLSLATYGFLAHKIGFVRAERLMERGEILDAEQMHDILLVKSVAESGAGIKGIEGFLARTGRRHNSCYGIYRAHRMASPAVAESVAVNFG